MTKMFLNGLMLLGLLFGGALQAQDLIVKLKGDTIKAKVSEVGVSTVTYKKFSNQDGPTFVVNKSELLFIKFSNGEIMEFMDETTMDNAMNDIKKNQEEKADSIKKAAMNDQKMNTADSTKIAQQNSGTKNKIEFLDNEYYINGTQASKKDVDKYLGKSVNPAIQLGLKGAKSMSTAQKIVKITSYPTTIAGSMTSLVTLVNGYQNLQRGRTHPGDKWKIISSILGTAAFPITNKILTKKKNKMYDKLIDMYNVTN